MGNRYRVTKGSQQQLDSHVQRASRSTEEFMRAKSKHAKKNVESGSARPYRTVRLWVTFLITMAGKQKRQEEESNSLSLPVQPLSLLLMHESSSSDVHLLSRNGRTGRRTAVPHGKVKEVVTACRTQDAAIAAAAAAAALDTKKKTWPDCIRSTSQ